MAERLRVGIVGATGYTGAELVRLVLGHPHLELGPVVGRSSVGDALDATLPSLRGLVDRTVEAFDPDDLAARSDVVFCALPHGASAEHVGALRDRGLVVFDLSADFRLADRAAYETWYGTHGAPGRFGEATYGLVELHRARLRDADLVAVPGCYPTASILPLAPLVARGLVRTDRPLIIDAKSGVSGAGRAAKARTHFPETAESLRPYALGGRHRHTPEIEQELGRQAGGPVRVIFSPHLVPMIRGILAVAYAEPAVDGLTAERCAEEARAFYEGSPSVEVLAPHASPDTLWVRGSNRAMVAYTQDERSGWILAQGAIDNLVKGASGQAIQALNVRFGFPEGAGLGAPPAWP